jgi:YVTN family beta-propeller protein
VLVGALAIAIVGVVGAAAAVALGGRGGSAAVIPPGPDTVVTLAGDSGAVVDVRQVPAGPVTIAADTDRLWVGSLDAGVVSSLPTVGTSGSSQQIGRVGQPTGLALGNGQAWSADAFDQRITLIETATGAVNKTISGVEARQIEFGGGSGWAADDLSDSIHRLDGQSGDTVATIALDAGALPRALAVGPDSLWVANAGTSTVARIDLTTSAVTAGAIPLRYVPDSIAAGPTDVWIASSASDTLLRLDPATNAVAATTPVCDQPAAVAADVDEVWVACRGTHEVWHLDHGGGLLSKTAVGGAPTDIAVLGDRVFVTVRR